MNTVINIVFYVVKCIDSMPMFEFIQKRANEDVLCWLVLVNLTQT